MYCQVPATAFSRVRLAYLSIVLMKYFVVFQIRLSFTWYDAFDKGSLFGYRKCCKFDININDYVNDNINLMIILMQAYNYIFKCVLPSTAPVPQTIKHSEIQEVTNPG